MPSGGHNVKPTSLRMLEGTYRADRQKRKTVETSAELPKKPPSIKADKVASVHWDLLINERSDWISKSDGPALQLVCEQWSQLREAKKAVDAEPTDHKAFIRFERLTAMWHKHAARFGLTPVDRERLGITKADSSKDELARRFLA